MEEIIINMTRLLKIVDAMSTILLIISTAMIIIACKVIDISKIYAGVLFLVSFVILCLAMMLNEAYYKYKISKKDFYKSINNTGKEKSNAISNWDSRASIG